MHSLRNENTMIVVAVVLLLLPLVAARALDAEQRATPFGRVHRDCFHEVPSGSQLTRLPEGGLLVSDERGTPLRRLPPCAHAVPLTPRAPAARTAASASASSAAANATAKLGTYDGWLAYTQWENAGAANGGRCAQLRLLR